MASVGYLDTHVTAWLYQRGSAEVSTAARDFIASCDELLVSPIVRLELAYLHEIGRLAVTPIQILDSLARSLGVRTCEAPFAAVAAAAEKQTWTRDPFDRIIVGHAALRKAVLVTKDDLIRTNYPQAIW